MAKEARGPMTSTEFMENAEDAPHRVIAVRSLSSTKENATTVVQEETANGFGAP